MEEQENRMEEIVDQLATHFPIPESDDEASDLAGAMIAYAVNLICSDLSPEMLSNIAENLYEQLYDEIDMAIAERN